MRGQGQIPSKHWPKYSRPPGWQTRFGQNSILAPSKAKIRNWKIINCFSICAKSFLTFLVPKSSGPLLGGLPLEHQLFHHGIRRSKSKTKIFQTLPMASPLPFHSLRCSWMCPRYSPSAQRLPKAPKACSDIRHGYTDLCIYFWWASFLRALWLVIFLRNLSRNAKNKYRLCFAF